MFSAPPSQGFHSVIDAWFRVQSCRTLLASFARILPSCLWILRSPFVERVNTVARLTSVRGLIAKNHEVFFGIVRLVAVYVVNALSAIKVAAKHLLGDQAMLENVTVLGGRRVLGHSHVDVAGRGNHSTALPSMVGRSSRRVMTGDVAAMVAGPNATARMVACSNRDDSAATAKAESTRIRIIDLFRDRSMPHVFEGCTTREVAREVRASFSSRLLAAAA